MSKVPQEVIQFLEALSDKPGNITQSRVTGHMQRDMMKLAELARKMKLTKLSSMSEEQRNHIALGWLCGAFHENSGLLQTLGGQGHSGMMEAVLGTCMGDDTVDVYYDIRENVVVNFLDGEEFSRKALKGTKFGQTIAKMQDRTQRLIKILKATRKDEDEDDEEEMDVTSIRRPVSKTKKDLN